MRAPPPEANLRKSKFSESQIVGAIKRADSGVPVKDICRELGMSTATLYQWRSKYSGLEASDEYLYR